MLIPAGLRKKKKSPNWIMQFRFEGKRYCKSTRTRNLTLAMEQLEAFKGELNQDPHRGGICEIYFMQAGKGPIKIGFSTNIKSRLPEIQRWHPEEIRLLKTVKGRIEGEKDIHRLFREDRIRGEWFKPSDKLMAFINGLQDFYESKKERRRRLKLTLGPK